MNLPEITRDYMHKRDRWARAHEQAARFPSISKPAPSSSAFAIIMDDACKAIRDLPEFSEFTPLDWEALLELLPNMRKILGIQGGEGGW